MQNAFGVSPEIHRRGFIIVGECTGISKKRPTKNYKIEYYRRKPHKHKVRYIQTKHQYTIILQNANFQTFNN